MAILKKGILGTPKGKIGQMMAYQRNGKGIIQTLPTVKEPYKRRYNLLESLFRNQILHSWNTLSASNQSQWGSIAEPGESNFDAYTRYFLERAYDNEMSNLNLMALIPGYLNTYQNTLVASEWNLYLLHFFIDPSKPYWTDPGTPNVNYQFYDLNGALIKNISYNPSPSDGNIFLEMKWPESPQAAIVGIVFRQLSPNKVYFRGNCISAGMNLITRTN